jgi:predicted GH43/DUF377 family glycosyl hydrolase
MVKESLATKRAKERGYFDKDSTWYCEFNTSNIKGLEVEEGIHRRDPSSVILVDNTYYMWFTKSYGTSVGFGTGDLEAKVFPWDKSEIWYASSKDGITWKEEGLAIERGVRGSYDDRSCFTPEILHHDGMFYLVYQVVKHPYVNRVRENIAIASSKTPHGPWTKSATPIIEPSTDGEWEGQDDNRFLVKKHGSFDSLKVHDPVLFYFNDMYYLYYKGEPMGEQMYMGGRETKWGVATATNPMGPYTKSEYNPISNSGHETLLWKYNGGIAALLCTDGMERNTMQYAKDGINFEIMGAIKCAPEAAGPFRIDEKDMKAPLDGLRWGLSHKVDCPWNYIIRFDINEELKTKYLEKKNYE